VALIKASWLSLVLVFAACACGHQDAGPVSPDKMNTFARNKDLPIPEQIQKLQADPNIPAPEKERMVRILESQQAAHK